jgi:hypothetical protein
MKLHAAPFPEAFFLVEPPVFFVVDGDFEAVLESELFLPNA